MLKTLKFPCTFEFVYLQILDFSVTAFQAAMKPVGIMTA